jgi:hypothetical protein
MFSGIKTPKDDFSITFFGKNQSTCLLAKAPAPFVEVPTALQTLKKKQSRAY